MKHSYTKKLSPPVVMKSSLFLVIPFLILAVACLYEFGWLKELDRAIAFPVLASREPDLSQVFVVLTELGGVPFSIALILVVLFVLYRMKEKGLALWFGLTVALGAGALNQALKTFFERPRPSVEHIVEQGGYSFPSGHSMGSTIVYGAIVFLIVVLSTNRTLKWVSLLFAIVLVSIVGYSRIYLGVHYPSDVIGGFSLGAAWLATCIGIYGLWRYRKNDSPQQ